MCMIAVGLGSFTFHTKPCFFTQLLDELPMAVLAILYLLTFISLHPTLPSNSLLFVSIGSLVIFTTSFAAYAVFEVFEIFLHTFTFFITCVVLVAGDILRRAHAPRRKVSDFTTSHSAQVITSSSGFYHSILLIIAGRVFWETERALFHAQKCPYSALYPSFWLHPSWHLISALAHMRLIDFSRGVGKGTNSKDDELAIEIEELVPQDRAYPRSKLFQ